MYEKSNVKLVHDCYCIKFPEHRQIALKRTFFHLRLFHLPEVLPSSPQVHALFTREQIVRLLREQQSTTAEGFLIW